jgi:hypothetical protein
VQEQDRDALAVVLDIQGDAVRLDDPAVVWAHHDPDHGMNLAALAPPEHDQYRYDEDEQDGRYHVIRHAACLSITAA